MTGDRSTWERASLTDASVRLRVLAARVARTLPDAFVGLAVTGSAARGDASAGSDLDLWAVATAPGPPLSFLFEGVPTTCFVETASFLEDLTHLATVEAECLHIVHDANLVLRAARELAREKYGTLCRAALAQNHVALAELQRGAPKADAPLVVHLLHHREVADVQAVLALLRAGHRASPRPRTIARVLGPDAHCAYLRVQGLDDLPSTDAMKVQWASRAEVLESARSAGLEVGRVSDQDVRSSAVMRKLECDERAEAVRAARQWYRRVVWPARLRAERDGQFRNDHPDGRVWRDDEAFWMGSGAASSTTTSEEDARRSLHAASQDFARAVLESH